LSEDRTPCHYSSDAIASISNVGRVRTAQLSSLGRMGLFVQGSAYVHRGPLDMVVAGSPVAPLAATIVALRGDIRDVVEGAIKLSRDRGRQVGYCPGVSEPRLSSRRRSTLAIQMRISAALRTRDRSVRSGALAAIVGGAPTSTRSGSRQNNDGGMLSDDDRVVQVSASRRPQRIISACRRIATIRAACLWRLRRAGSSLRDFSEERSGGRLAVPQCWITHVEAECRNRRRRGYRTTKQLGVSPKARSARARRP